MTKYTLKRFSSSSKKDDEEKKKNDNKNKDLNTILGLGGIGAGLTMGNIIHNKIKERKEPSEESKNLYDKLKNKFNGSIIDDDDVRDTKFNLRNASSYFFPDLGIGAIKLDKSYKGDASTLAHEMGHSYFYNPNFIKDEKSNNNNVANKIGKFLHKNEILRKAKNNDTGISVAAGLISGINKARLERKGKKEGIVNKIAPYIVTGAVSAGEVGTELAASIKGYKMLKNLGASKKMLNDAKKDLGLALSTYVGKGAIDLALTKGGRTIGDSLAKLHYAIKDKKKKKKGDEDNE